MRFLPEQRAPEAHRIPVRGGDDDRPARAHAAHGVVQRRLAPRRIDDHLVLVEELAPGAEPLARAVLMRVASRQVDVDAACPRDGDECEADRAPADDQDSRAGLERDAPERVPRDRERLDEGADLRTDTGGQGDEATAVHDDLVGEAAVDRDTVQS